MEEQFSVLIMKQHRTEAAPLQKHQDLGCRAQERFWGHSEGGTLQRVEGGGGDCNSYKGKSHSDSLLPTAQTPHMLPLVLGK